MVAVRIRGQRPAERGRCWPLVFREQVSEWCGEFSLGYLLGDDPDASENRLVEDPAGVGIGEEVAGLDAVGHAQCDFEPLQCFAVVDLQFSLALFGGDAGLAKAALLLGEQLAADVIAIVGLKELLLLRGQFLELLTEFCALWVRLGIETLDVGLNVGSDLLAGFLAEFDLGVLIFDRALDRFDSVVRLAAVAELTATAGEVLIDRPVTASGPRVDQPAAALLAEHRPTQVVVVAPAALARGSLRGQNLLYPLESLVVRQLWVKPLTNLAVVANESYVVVVAQQRLDAVVAQRDVGAVGPAAAPEAGAFQDGRQLSGRVVPGGVQLERSRDQGPTVGVDRDRSNLSAVDQLTNVEITDRGSAWRAATQGFLGGALHDFGSQVA